jgi:lysozyme
MKKLVIWLFVIVGAALGLVWWFNVEQTGGSFADFFRDPVGGLQSLGSRLSLWVQSLFEQAKGAVGGTVDARALAASKIANFEGFVDHTYADPPGQAVTYSIGYGHQLRAGDGFTTGSTINEGDALALLEADLDTYATCVDNAVTVPLAPEQAAALYSLCYNIGCSRFEGSTLLRLLNQSDYTGAQEQFAVWNKAGSPLREVEALTARRAAEAELFASAAAPPAVQQTSDASGEENA